MTHIDHLSGCCGEDAGYLVERIKHHCMQEINLREMLVLHGLFANLRPPLKLCDAKIVGIAPSYPSCAVDCCARRIVLTLRCSVCDCCGRRAQADAHLTVALKELCPSCAGQLRLAARLQLDESAFCPPCSFKIFGCLQVIAITTQGGRIVSHCPLCNPCACMPLYPQPRYEYGRKAVHFSQSACQNTEND